MYTEERRRGSLLKDFILKLILIIIFVLLLIWLVPWPNMDSLNPLKDQIFNANLQTMKEAGITYFTTERLPEEVGDKTTLTLEEMLKLHLIVPFTDKNGDSCDVKKSFISLEKKETEYLMKVNLKCGEEEQYILVHLGCYSYCTTDICEKQNEKDKPIKNTPKPTYTPPTDDPVKPTPIITDKPVPVPKKQYEYLKKMEATYSNWSEWATHVKKENDGVVFGLTATKEVVDLGTKEVQIGVKEAEYQNVINTQKVQEVIDNYTYTVCKGYNYIADIDTVYRVDSEFAYINNWYYGSNPPADTASSRWIFQGIKWDNCEGTCTSHPVSIYRQQTRKVTEFKVYSNITATCTETEKRSIPIYGERELTEVKKVLIKAEEPIMANVRYYKVRTRTLLTKEETLYKWSSYNDQNLLSQGYSLTGKTRSY